MLETQIVEHKKTALSELSERLLLQVKLHKSTARLEKQLKDISWDDLRKALSSDSEKKAFWINIYNAFFLILRRDRQVEKPAVYRDKLITIAGKRWSLDDIEHGILRRYRWRWALGYLPDLFAPGDIKKLAPSRLDYRIHFALNCGAKSCPPITFYTTDRLEEQLTAATIAFLQSETEVFPEKREVHVTRLLQWYIGDFGGPWGLRRILRKYLGLRTEKMALIYRDYNWDEQLDNFVP